MRRALTGSALYAEIARIVASHLDPRRHRAWIVGSEAKGTALPGSDIDLVLEGPAKIDLGVLARLRDSLEKLPTIRSVDLVDRKRTSERFRRDALATSISLDLAGSGATHVEA